MMKRHYVLNLKRQFARLRQRPKMMRIDNFRKPVEIINFCLILYDHLHMLFDFLIHQFNREHIDRRLVHFKLLEFFKKKIKKIYKKLRQKISAHILTSVWRNGSFGEVRQLWRVIIGQMLIHIEQCVWAKNTIDALIDAKSITTEVMFDQIGWVCYFIAFHALWYQVWIMLPQMLVKARYNVKFFGTIWNSHLLTKIK
jgi:hypothetical protein